MITSLLAVLSLDRSRGKANTCSGVQSVAGRAERKNKEVIAGSVKPVNTRLTLPDKKLVREMAAR